MKYYYNGELMRTSKNHIYTHAVIWKNDNGTMVVIGCSGNRESAESKRRAEISHATQELEFFKRLKQARENNKVGFFAKRQGMRKEMYCKTNDFTSEYYANPDERIKYYTDKIEEYWDHTEVVELEQR